MGMKPTEIEIEAQIGVARMERWQIVHVGSMESGHCGAFSDRGWSCCVGAFNLKGVVAGCWR